MAKYRVDTTGGSYMVETEEPNAVPPPVAEPLMKGAPASPAGASGNPSANVAARTMAPALTSPVGNANQPGFHDLDVNHLASQFAVPGLDSKLHAAHEALSEATDSAVHNPIGLAAGGEAGAGASLLPRLAGIGGGLGAQKLATKAAQKIGAPQGTSEIAGDVSGLLGGKLADEIAGVYGPVVGGLWQRFTDKDPAVQMIKWCSPTPSQSNFHDRAAQTRDNIVDAAGTKPTSNEEAIEAMGLHIQKSKANMEKWLEKGETEGATVDGDKIVSAVRGAIPKIQWRESPKSAQAIVDEAEAAYGGKQIPVREADSYRGTLQANLRTYHNGTDAQKIATLSQGNDPAIMKAKADAFKTELYSALDPENDGAGPRGIRREMSDVLTLMDAAKKRTNVAIGSKPESTAMGVAGAGQKVAQAVMGGTGISYAKAADLTNPRTIMQGSIDPQVRRFFMGAEKRAVPQPLPK